MNRYNPTPDCQCGHSWISHLPEGEYCQIENCSCQKFEARSRNRVYPYCPYCGHHVVGAMMTGRSIEQDGKRYYHPDDISVYCESADCNYDQKLSNLPTPSRLRTQKGEENNSAKM